METPRSNENLSKQNVLVLDLQINFRKLEAEKITLKWSQEHTKITKLILSAATSPVLVISFPLKLPLSV